MRLLSDRPVRLPRLRAHVPRPGDPAIFWFNSERDDIVEEVVRRVVEQAAQERTRAERALRDAAYHEIRRLETQHDAEATGRLPGWRSLARRISHLSNDERRDALERIATRMARDVAGNFDPRVYRLSEHVVPRLLTGVMKPSSLPRGLFDSGRGKLKELLRTEGALDPLRSLATRGTLIFVPTHSSNLDSVVLGYGLMQAGLPPVVYGAGKNLFSNPIIRFFMHNLGAYRIDRRVKASLYKDVLKTYSSVMVERGYHSLFFPGGTRSRSGMIENHLKLGLLGSVVEAFVHNCTRGLTRPIFVVPTSINYALVLEAETLIQDQLAAEGKARYIIEDDEFSKLDRWIAFLRSLIGLSSACIVRFGRPVDPFGNDVDDEGRSLGPHGEVVDPVTYVSRHGKPTLDLRRDQAYTRELGQLLLARFRTETVILPTQLVAHVLFRRLVQSTPGEDIFARVRRRGDVTVLRSDLVRELSETRNALLRLVADAEVRVDETVRTKPPEEILDTALAAFDGYHVHEAAAVRGPEIVAEDPTLLLYYQNRLVPYAERIAGENTRAAAREIAAMEHRS